MVRRESAGFTLVELLISVAVMATIMVAVLTLFIWNTRTARYQTRMAQMQQSARVAQTDMTRTTRMAGRGGLPRGDFPNTLALRTRNNVPASGDDHHIAVADTSSPEVVEDTDILTVRGVFSTPIYQINTAAGSLVLDSAVAPTSGTVRVQSPNPETGVPQDLSPLEDAMTDGTPEALILVSAAGDQIYAVVEFDPTAGNSTVDARDADGNPIDMTLAFNIGTAGGTEDVDKYLALSAGGVFPNELLSIAFVGIVEEYRYYVRAAHIDPLDATSEVRPRLSRARFLPGTETAHPSDPNLNNDIADDIIDLQIAIGIDATADGIVTEDPNSPATDEWLYNDPGDDATDAGWNIVAGTTADVPNMGYVRVTTLARTERPDPQYLSPAIQTIEDRVYGEPDIPASEEERLERIYRRRAHQSVIDLRNVG